MYTWVFYQKTVVMLFCPSFTGQYPGNESDSAFVMMSQPHSGVYLDQSMGWWGQNESARLALAMSHPLDVEKGVTFSEHLGKRAPKENRGPSNKEKRAELVRSGCTFRRSSR